MKKTALKNETLDVIPDPTLFGKLGARSKALPNVITELVDNSLDSWTLMPASLKRGKILEVRIIAGSVEGAAFTVQDNAGGMTRDELRAAMTIARSDKGAIDKGGRKMLGFYGFGLKSAAMFIGDQFSIYTQSYTENMQKVIHYVDFDRTKFEDADSEMRWKLEFKSMSVDEGAKRDIVFEDGHGTLIRIKNKRYTAAKKYGIVERLQRTFAPRLPCDPRVKVMNERFSYEPMHIYFITRESQQARAQPLKALGAFYTYWENDKSAVEKFYANNLRELKAIKDREQYRQKVDAIATTDVIKGSQADDEGRTTEAVLPAMNWYGKIPGWREIPAFKVGKKLVRGRVAILDRGMGHTSEYGFDLIKNGRVIETFAKDPEKKAEQYIGLVSNNHNARIVGQLFLDEWATDHQKTEFIKEEPGWSKENADKKRKDSKGQYSSIAEAVSEFLKDSNYISASYGLQSPKTLIPGARSQSDEEALIVKKVSDDSPIIESRLTKGARSKEVTAKLNKIEKEGPASIEKDLKKLKEEAPTASSKLQTTKPEIKWEKKGKAHPLYAVKTIEEKKFRRLIVALNLDHKFVSDKETGQLKVIGELLAAEALAAYMAKEKLIIGVGFDQFLSLRDDLLSESI